MGDTNHSPARTHYIPLCLDVKHNEWVVKAIFEPGAALPLHYYTGPVDLHHEGTVVLRRVPRAAADGRVLPVRAGRLRSHPLTVPADKTEETHLVVRVSGTNINFNEAASFHSLLDAVFLRHLTDTLA